jgi:DNA-binding MarR family transcriptional regulator
MENTQILIEKLYRTMNLIIQEMETPWRYGVNFPLYHAEVHLLEMIKSQEGANVGELARHLGMTSGAVSQVTKKLLSKELIETYKKPGNRKEVFSRLTALGEVVCQGHQKHHENMIAALREFMDNCNDKEAQLIFDCFDTMFQSMEHTLEKAQKTI